jgi:hypothetical protein
LTYKIPKLKKINNGVRKNNFDKEILLWSLILKKIKLIESMKIEKIALIWIGERPSET